VLDPDAATDAAIRPLVGYDLDGAERGHCGPASRLHQRCGIDNAGGEVSTRYTQDSVYNDLASEGVASLPVLRIRGVGAEPNAGQVWAAWYRSAPLGHAPTWDGSDAVEARAESVQNEDVDAPVAALARSYVASDKFVSDEDATLTFDMHIDAGRFLVVTLHHAIVTLNLAPDRRSGTRGVVAGVVDALELADAQTDGLYAPDGKPCDGNTFMILHQMADMDLTPGAAQNPPPCNALSFAFGFEASAVRIVGVAPPLDPPKPCKGYTL
jgi:hypothetical protein